jgi:predicted nuclease of predicted toxin-antitoxin system
MAADECRDATVIARLRADGHDIVFFQEVSRGADDLVVLQTASDQQRILLTEDKDFGELVVHFGLPAFGIVLLRLPEIGTDAKLERLRVVLRDFGNRFANALVVVEPDRIRFRPLYRPKSMP